MGSAHSTLKAMEDARLDYEHGVSIVFHKKNRKGTVVSMMLDDFIPILEKLKNK